MEHKTMGENGKDRDERGRLLPGHAPTPGSGRPPGTLSLIGLLKKQLEETPEGEKRSRADALIDKIIAQAQKGDAQSQKLIMNYIEGLPNAKLDVTSGGKPIPILGNVSSNERDKENPVTPEAS